MLNKKLALYFETKDLGYAAFLGQPQVIGRPAHPSDFATGGMRNEGFPSVVES
jgi:hypothetical protein